MVASAGCRTKAGAVTGDQSAAGDDRAALPLVFLWENFGPSHRDRLRAVAGAGYEVTAIELFGASHVYDWERDGGTSGWRTVTLARQRGSIGPMALARRIVNAVRESGARHAFMCHYNEPAVFLAALVLRARGMAVFTMLDSKEDDRKRSRSSRWLRRLSLAPYRGALVAGPRSREYAQSLGIAADRIASDYNALDVASLKAMGETAQPIAFGDRAFLVVARLVGKKNIPAALRAFGRYVRDHGGKRRLAIIGEGPERARLQELAGTLQVGERVDWLGGRPRAEVAVAMRRAHALVLPSTVEQYGLVVAEALAQGLVPIVTARAGSVDVLIDNGVNGLVFEPEDEQALLDAMLALDMNEDLWRQMSVAALTSAWRGDIRHFVASVNRLVAG